MFKLNNKSWTLYIAHFDAYIIGSDHLLGSIAVTIFGYIANKWLWDHYVATYVGIRGSRQSG